MVLGFFGASLWREIIIIAGFGCTLSYSHNEEA